MNNRRFVLAIALIMHAGSSLCEQAYVTDILQLQLKKGEDEASDTLTRLTSGDRLTVLEKGPSLTKVVTDSGQTGWVKSWFLVQEPPARAKLSQLTSENEKLAASLDELRLKLQTVTKNANREIHPLQERLEALQQTLAHSNESLRAMKQENQALKAAALKSKLLEPDHLALIGLCLLSAGILLGLWVNYAIHNYRQRKRLCGFRLAG